MIPSIQFVISYKNIAFLGVKNCRIYLKGTILRFTGFLFCEGTVLCIWHAVSSLKQNKNPHEIQGLSLIVLLYFSILWFPFALKFFLVLCWDFFFLFVRREFLIDDRSISVTADLKSLSDNPSTQSSWYWQQLIDFSFKLWFSWFFVGWVKFLIVPWALCLLC